MGCSKIFNYNLVDQPITTIYSANENLLFPATNIKDPHTTKVYRSTTASDRIIFDLVNPDDVSHVMLRGNFLTNLGVTTATIQANNTANFSSPAFSQVLTLNYQHGFAYEELSSVQNYRFWSLLLTGFPVCEISNVFLGTELDLGAQNGISNGFSYSLMDESDIQRNRYNQKFVDTKNLIKGLDVSYDLMNPTELEDLIEVYKYNGKNKPVWFITDTGENIYPDKFEMAGVFYVTSQSKINHEAFALYNLKLSLEETG